MSSTRGSRGKHRKGRRDHASHQSRLPGSPVVQKKNEPAFLRDTSVTSKILDCILDSPNGKRSLLRVARTCKAMQEPALDALWKEQDSFVPLLSQFPGHLLKKSRKPGIGFVKTPVAEDWQKVLKYADRIRQVTYNEEVGNIAISIFSMLEKSCPRPFILPRLEELTWKIESPINLNHCAMFITPELRAINFEIGIKVFNLTPFLSDVLRRTTLSSFSFISSAILPDAFTNSLRRQGTLEKVSLVAPGALAPGIGRWLASLPQLRALHLDLTGRSPITIGGFFEELSNSGASTLSTDSGIFSDDEGDYSIIMSKSKKNFANLRKLHLSGEVASIAAFTAHINCPLTQLKFVMEDPPDPTNWRKFLSLICDEHGNTLQSLKINATASSRPPREPGTRRLPLQGLSGLKRLSRLEIDLPESIIFAEADVESLARACPNLEVLKLCPSSWSHTAPQITFDSLASLLMKCRKLHSIAAVVDARRGHTDILKTRRTSSLSLLRLQVGHSWVDDPLWVAILLSHVAPRLESLKFFQEKSRPGFVDAHARHWQTVTEHLPYFQDIRFLEQQLSSGAELFKPELQETFDQGVEAAIRMVEKSVEVAPAFCDAATGYTLSLEEKVVQAQQNYRTISIDATPATSESSVEAFPDYIDQEVDPIPLKLPTTDADVSNIKKAIAAMITPGTFKQPLVYRRPLPILFLPSILHFLSFAYRVLVLLPASIPTRVIRSTTAKIHWKVAEPTK